MGTGELTRDDVILLTEFAAEHARTGDVDLDDAIVEASNRVLVAVKRGGWGPETGYEVAFVLRRLVALVRIHDGRLNPVTASGVLGLLGEAAKALGG